MFRSILASLTLAAALFATPAHADDRGAMETFKESHDTVLQLVKKKKGDDAIEKEVDKFLDYKWIAQQSLGGPARYEKKCAPRCAEFEQILTRLIRENYLHRIYQSDSGSIDYKGEELRKNGTKAKVDTVVAFEKNGQKQRLEISYVMHKLDDGTWVCRNMITDGVSLAKTWRYDFAQVLKKEGIDGLIARLQNKLGTVAKAD